MIADKDKSRKQMARVRLQQNIVSLCCLLCVVFAVGWIIHSAGKKSDFLTSSSDPQSQSSSTQSSVSDSSSKSDSSSGDSLSQADSSITDSSAPQPEDPDQNVHPYAQPKDTADELENTLFIGDSRTVGLFNICDKPKATFYCAVGLNVQTVFQTPAVALDNGSMGTVEQALAQGHKYSRVYINFGTNEMGWPYYDSFIELYKKLVDTIRKYSPDAKIYVESILPVTASRDQQGDAINNKNVQALNEYIKKFAADNSCTYLQCDKAVMGQDGKLPQEASPDGVHLNIDYCRYWLNYIIDET